MNLHRNSPTTPASRAALVRRVLSEGQAPKAVATAFGVDVKTVNKWVARFVTEGPAGLADRSSRPKRLRDPTPSETVERIIRCAGSVSPASRSPGRHASRRRP